MGLLNIFDCIHQHTGMSRPEYQILPWGNPKLPASLKLKIEFFSYCLSLSHESAKVQKMIGFPWLCCLAWLRAWSLKRNRVFTNWSTSSQALILPSYFPLWALIKTTLQEKSITCMKSGIFCQTFVHLDPHQQIYNVPAISLKVQVLAGHKVEGESIGGVSIIGCQRRLVSSFKVYKFAFWTWEWRLNWV